MYPRWPIPDYATTILTLTAHFTTFDAPGACSSDSNPACVAEGTIPESINLFGVITGRYYGADDVGHGFVSYPPYNKWTFTAIDAPGACSSACFGAGTFPSSINGEGVVTGFFYDASDVAHGFLSRPPYSTVTTFDAPEACSSDSNPHCSFNGTFAFGIDVEGVFTGAAYDAAGNSHGFVARQHRE